MRKYFCLAVTICFFGTLMSKSASAQLINEVDINPPGTDQPCEYIELKGTPGAALTSLFFVAFEGDTGSTPGTADLVLQFGTPAPVFGSNGLVVVTGTAACGARTYAAETTHLQTTLLDSANGLENGAISFLLINSPTTPITSGTDYDANNDGTLEGLPADATVLDAIAWKDAGVGIIYGGVELIPGGTPDAATRFPGNMTAKSAAAWYAGDLTGATNDSTTYAATNRSSNFPPDGALTPGALNVGGAKDAPVDMNGDGKTDWVVVRNISDQYTWYTAINGGSPQAPQSWGTTNDLLTSGDFDGDLKDDIVVYRPTNGTFYILESQTSTFRVDQLGQGGDNPSVVADYNGDGKDDVAVYRPATGTWYYRTAANVFYNTVQWGQSGDFAAPGDYDGDGKSDFVIQRAGPSGEGVFYKNLSTAGLSTESFGLATDFIVPGDYDGDGKTDVATLRGEGANFVWRFEPSGTAGSTVVQDTWGLTASDFPAQGDYDGDGKTDYAIWRATNGTFYVMTVGTRRITTQPWGANGDRPVATYNVH